MRAAKAYRTTGPGIIQTVHKTCGRLRRIVLGGFLALGLSACEAGFDWLDATIINPPSEDPRAKPGVSADAIDRETVWFTRDEELSAPSVEGLDRLLSILLRQPDLASEVVCGRPMQPLQLRKQTVYHCALVYRYLTDRGITQDRIDYRIVLSPPGPQIDVAIRPGPNIPLPGSGDMSAPSPRAEEALPPRRTIF